MKKGLRSVKEIDRQLGRLKQEFIGRDFTSIKRRDIANLLDKLAENCGDRSADYALQVFSGMANWYATRDDDYTSPIVRGMARRNQKENARSRTLSDDELRAIWKAAEANGTFGAMVRILLLTGQRRTKVATMKWEDIDADGVWDIATEKREKGNAASLPLPQIALDIINSRPCFTDNPYVFPGRANKHYHSFSSGKEELEAKMPDNMPQWGLHDLRRTARSLMARAGVRDDHAERVLGHAIRGVEGVYNRHEYKQENEQALKALAKMIESILNPAKESNVRRLARN
jgi:integrase